MKTKQDPTINGYATMIREYMGGHTQVELEKMFDIHRNGLSGLLRGATFPKQEKIELMLDFLSIPPKKKNMILDSIKNQRLFPVIKDRFFGFRLKAVRIMNKIRIKDLVDSNLTESFVQQIEGGLLDISSDKRLYISQRLGSSVYVNDDRRKIYNELLERYSEEDLLTVGLFLLNKHESRNKSE